MGILLTRIDRFAWYTWVGRAPGVVYAAYDENLDRRVALGTPSRSLSRPRLPPTLLRGWPPSSPRCWRTAVRPWVLAAAFDLCFAPVSAGARGRGARGRVRPMDIDL